MIVRLTFAADFTLAEIKRQPVSIIICMYMQSTTISVYCFSPGCGTAERKCRVAKNVGERAREEAARIYACTKQHDKRIHFIDKLVDPR